MARTDDVEEKSGERMWVLGKPVASIGTCWGAAKFETGRRFYPDQLLVQIIRRRKRIEEIWPELQARNETLIRL